MRNTSLPARAALALAIAGTATLAVGDTAANGTTAPAEFDCSKLTAPAADDAAATAVYASKKLICDQIDRLSLEGQLAAAKRKGIADALAGFSSIQGMTGAVTNPTAADHLGDWLAQYTLNAAAREVGRRVNSKLTEPTSLVTDSAMLASRSRVRSTVASLKIYANAFDTLSQRASNSTASFAPIGAAKAAGADGKELSLLDALALVAPVLSAAQSVAGAFKVNTSLSALAVTVKPEVIWAGVSACAPDSRDKVLIPSFTTRDDNPLTDVYQDTKLRYMKAKLAALDMKAKIDSLKVNEKASAEFTGLKAELDKWLTQFEAYDGALNLVATGKTTSLFDDLVAVADLTGSGTTGIFLVTASNFGASGGVRSSKWSSDKLSYRATVELTYILANSSGLVIEAGVVTKTNSTLVDADADLSTLRQKFPLTADCKDAVG